MARVTSINREKRVKGQTKIYTTMVVMGVIALAIFLWFTFFSKNSGNISADSFSIVFAAAILVFAFCAMYAKNRYGIQESINASLKGEKATNKVLEEELSDRYVILSDVDVTVDGKEGQIDSLVVGPTGVFVLESKAWGGKIAVDSRRKWTIEYVGESGADMRRKVISPIEEVDGKTEAVEDYIKANNITLNGAIYDMLIFTERSSAVNISDLKSKISICTLHGEKVKLVNFISNRKNIFGEDKVRDIVKLFAPNYEWTPWKEN